VGAEVAIAGLYSARRAVEDSGLPFDRLVSCLPQRVAATPSAMGTELAENTNSGANNALTSWSSLGSPSCILVGIWVIAGEITIELPKAP
jgi:hypothetical protein